MLDSVVIATEELQLKLLDKNLYQPDAWLSGAQQQQKTKDAGSNLRQ